MYLLLYTLLFARQNRSGKTSAPSFIEDTVDKNDLYRLKRFHAFAGWNVSIWQSDYSEKSELPVIDKLHTKLPLCYGKSKNAQRK